MKTGGSPFYCSVALVLAQLFVCGCGKKAGGEPEAAITRTEQAQPDASDAKIAPLERLQWNLQTLVGTYLARGHRDPSWDDSATNALGRFALIRCGQGDLEAHRKAIAEHSRTSVLKGCGDPMVLYLYAREVIGYQEDVTYATLSEGYQKALLALRRHGAAPIRQAYMALRAAEALNEAAGGKGDSPEVHTLRHRSLRSLLEALRDPGIPPIEVYELCNAVLVAVKRNPKQHLEFFGRLEPILDRNWPEDGHVQLLKGSFHTDEAWRRRGSGYADTVTEDGWKGFEEHLKKAEVALEKAWKLDPTNVEIPYEMMQVELGRGRGRERMEQWFGRAMKLNTNGASICKRKLYYLEPKWHGSAVDMLKFARECATSDVWGGEVLLMPLHAHETLCRYAERAGNTNYWKSSGVWREIKDALDRYYARYPEDVSWRHNYAMHAYRAEDWSEFNRQLLLFTTGTNYQYFGGRDVFERMVSNGRQRVSQTP